MPSRPLTALLAALALGGCGAQSIHELPPAAEPPRSPAPSALAAGRVIRVGGAPEGVAADPVSHRVAVALRAPPALALVDPARGVVVRRVALPGAARHLALAGPGGPVLVPAEDADKLLAVGLPGGRVLARVRTGATPHDVAAVAGGLAAVGDERANRVQLVRGDRIVRGTPVATQPGGLAPLDGGRLLAVVAVRERVLELYDARSLRRVARAPAGVGPTHVACLDDGPCYVVDTSGDALLVFSPAGRDGLRLRRRLYLPGGPYGIALDRVHRRLYVTLPARNEVVELPAHGRPHVVRRWPTVRQPDSVAVDPVLRVVYVTGRSSKTLQAISLGRP